MATAFVLAYPPTTVCCPERTMVDDRLGTELLASSDVYVFAGAQDTKFPVVRPGVCSAPVVRLEPFLSPPVLPDLPDLPELAELAELQPILPPSEAQRVPEFKGANAWRTRQANKPPAKQLTVQEAVEAQLSISTVACE